MIPLALNAVEDLLSEVKSWKQQHTRSSKADNIHETRISDDYNKWVNLLEDANIVIGMRSQCNKDWDFEAKFKSLDCQVKQFLFSFCLCPAEAELSRRYLTNCWMVTAEDETLVLKLEQLVNDGFIEIKKKKGITSGYKMNADVWSKVMEHSKHGSSGWANNVGVLEKGTGKPQIRPLNHEDTSTSQHRTNIQFRTLINERTILDMERGWLVELKMLEVLHLGIRSWSHDGNGKGKDRHIEVKDVGELMKKAKRLKRLKFLSLQGVSGILKLPSSICKLKNLKILDLRACHNLEELPKDIKSLRKLSHLDLSECYLLDYIPKGVTSLSELRVLKGFVICDQPKHNSCAFSDLHTLVKLQQLSVHSRRNDFPTEDDLNAIRKLVELQKLKIMWAAVSKDDKNHIAKNPATDQSKTVQSGCFPRTRILRRQVAFRTERWELNMLEKLELQAPPQAAATRILVPDTLPKLKKLYIIGGLIHGISQEKEPWKGVKMVRLKFLPKLSMDWRQFKNLFPDVGYLDTVQCPKLSFFPCDVNGVWEKLE